MEKGPVLVGTLTVDKFIKSAKQITNTIQDIPDDVLKTIFMKFLEVLEEHIKAKPDKSYSSKELIKDFLNKDLNLYKGVEVVIQIICAAAIKISVESDVESLVSRYEKHFKVDRQLG